ncbi:acetylornithine deacetylase [Bacteroidia bacterium]|nr:acetylornithine deacetylase [Bacteroidia bacterium]GHV70524.1 acetylornithine deacetylase [Bacteroidia bacterium]
MDINTSFCAAVDLLKQLIACPSVSREEKNLSDFLEIYLKERKFSPYRKGNNIWLFSPEWDDKKPVILLNSHIDTVKPVAGWTKNPFSPLEEDGKLFGLGSNDAGAPLVSLLHAFFLLTQVEQENNFIFLASAEEEVSGPNGVESVLPDLPPIDFGLVGEPTGLQVAIAEKGLMVLEGTIYGKSGHAAREEGDNAIYKALPVIEWFRNKQFPKISPLLGPVKMSVTLIQAGTQHNVIPGECKFTVDVRTNECYGNEALFKEIALECGCEIQARSFRLNASHILPEHPLVQRAVAFGLKLFGSPTLSDQSLMNFPSLKMGPGLSSRSHTADEFVYLSEIREAIDTYFRLLLNLKIRSK